MSINFPGVEEEVLRFWKEIDAFQTQVRLSEGKQRFTFYDGPPFGLPHYGHLLASTIKDVVPRYWSMKGHHVVRRFGWDTHGVPIEYEIDKKLGMSGKDAVAQLGIATYNAECRAIVMKYASDWRETIERLGRWIDFDNDYKTMDATFMESVWWVFKQLYDQGDVYRSYQIMPYSTALNTPLSNFEAQQNYKDAMDPAIIVSFPLQHPNQPNTSLLIYTTTPWTLPSNIAIAAHPDFVYAKLMDEATQHTYILLESRLSALYKDPKKAKFKITGTVTGREMLGWRYVPLFDYFTKEFEHAFRVINADYVTNDEGTGLVHTAPAFGPEDFEAATKAGIISPTLLPPNPVDESGCFTAEVPDYEGIHVKTADKAILKQLQCTGRLIVNNQAMHSVKFCWRSDTPLINKAVSSWFVKVTNSIPQMLQNIEETNWTPNFVKEKRFANWIAGARDWNISRNRYWGTPIPLWVSEDYEEVVCVGSIAELKRLSGYTGTALTDLHRDKIDGITIPSKRGGKPLRRVDEVFDCWFESGSMPYASQHYPFSFTDNEKFEGSSFPANFIAEGLDQTRGWFYTLVVLGTKLFGVAPFKNCIVNGIILAENGKKMSKRLKNYPDPAQVMNQYGSDALRVYLISSPVVRAEPLRFKESGVKEVVAKVLLPLWNSYRFLDEQITLFQKTHGTDFIFDPLFDYLTTDNVMDKWILANCQSLLVFVNQEMAGYRLYTVLPRLLTLLDNLTNWYIRFNRKRLKGQAGIDEKDTLCALNALFEVLYTLVRALAPFTPFLTEHIYRLLVPHIPKPPGNDDCRSVHFLAFPDAREDLFDELVERKVSRMQKAIELGRAARDKSNVGLKTPLRTLVVLANPEYVGDVRSLEAYVREELNIRELALTSDEKAYNVRLRALPVWAVIGQKFKKEAQKLRKSLQTLTNDQLEAFVKDKHITVDGLELNEDDLVVVKEVGQPDDSEASPKEQIEYTSTSDSEAIILLDPTLYADLNDEGLVRDLVSRIQRLRKKGGLSPTDDVHMEYSIVQNPLAIDLAAIIKSQQDVIRSSVRGSLDESANNTEHDVIVEETQEVAGIVLSLRLLKL